MRDKRELLAPHRVQFPGVLKYGAHELHTALPFTSKPARGVGLSHRIHVRVSLSQDPHIGDASWIYARIGFPHLVQGLCLNSLA